MGTKTTIAIAMHFRCVDCGASRDLGAIIDGFTCRRCNKANVVSPARWHKVLDTAVNDVPQMDAGAQHVHDDQEEEARVAARKVPPSCAGCAALLPDEAVSSGCETGSCFCPSCGAKLLVRPVPSSLAASLPGITHLFGEDIGQIANPDGPHMDVAEGGVVTCPNCGAGVDADGRSHAVVCSHCRSMVVLPDVVWDRIHPKSQPHVFYLVHDESVPRAPFRADFRWTRLECAVGDQDGTIYAVGGDEEAQTYGMVFALDAQFRTKWVQRGVKLLDCYSKIGWRIDGMILVWNTQRSEAVLLRSADGSVAGVLGGKQPVGSPIHTFDLALAQDAAVDTDRTVIFVKNQRLVRCAPDGSGIPIWPAHSGFLGRTIVSKPTPFTGSDDQDAPNVGEIRDYPTTVRNGKVAVGWDNCLYLSDSNHLARFERSGKKSYVVPLPERGGSGTFGADASGNAYVLVRHEAGETSSLLRVGPDGSPRRIVDGARKETPLADGKIVVRVDGTVVVMSGHQEIRVFGSDGRPLWRSKAAIDSDNEPVDSDDD